MGERVEWMKVWRWLRLGEGRRRERLAEPFSPRTFGCPFLTVFSNVSNCWKKFKLFLWLAKTQTNDQTNSRLPEEESLLNEQQA